MKGSSARHSPPFENLRLCQVEALLAVLTDATLLRREQIKRRYERHGLHFEETIDFLLTVFVARNDADGICLDDGQTTRSIGVSWGAQVLAAVLHRPSRYRQAVLRFLSKFTLHNGVVQFASNPLNRSRESGVRNFLMELGVVLYDSSKDCYFVNPEHTVLYANALEHCRRLSPSLATLGRLDRECFGLEAEVAALAWEIERVGDFLADRVRHIARDNTAAGYDLLSVTAAQDAVTPRFIEVKAVSAASLSFYWTANEMQMARLLGDLYYLYLVPVSARGELVVSELIALKAPFEAVLDEHSPWRVEAGTVFCTPKSPGVIAPC